MSRSEILKKLKLYKSKPDVFQPLSPNELADLVVVVLSQVDLLEKAINNGQLSISSKMTAEVNKVLADYKREAEKTVKDVQKLTQNAESYIVTGQEQLEKEVRDAIERINIRLAELKDGEDAEITEEHIRQAAEMALGLLELPDFSEIISNQLTGNPEAVRNALELLSGEDRYKVEIPDVQGLTEALNQLNRSNGAGTIGKGQVYGFIRQAIADGTIPSGSVPAGGTTGQVLTKLSNADGDADWVNPSGAGLGDVTGPTSSTDNNIAVFNLATGKIIKDGGATIAQVRDRSTHSGTQTASTISDFAETAQDAVGNILTDTTSIDLIYDDAGNTISAQREALTGDVTAAKNSNATTIANDAVTNAKMANMAVNTIKGRITAGTGDPEDLTAAQVRTITETETTTQLNTRDTNNRNRANHTGTQLASTISDFSEAVDDEVASLLVAGSNVTLTYNDVANTLTIAATGGGGGSGESTLKSVTQSSHGFSVGNVLKKTGTNYALAQADSAANAEVVGIVQAVADTNTFTLLMQGWIDTLTSLTANTTYFLSPTTAGAITTTAPSTVGQISKPLLNSVSTTAGVFNNMRGIEITSPSGGGGLSEEEVRAIARRYAIIF